MELVIITRKLIMQVFSYLFYESNQRIRQEGKGSEPSLLSAEEVNRVTPGYCYVGAVGGDRDITKVA